MTDPNTLAWAPMIRAEEVVRAPYRDAATAPLAEQEIAAADQAETSVPVSVP